MLVSSESASVVLVVNTLDACVVRAACHSSRVEASDSSVESTVKSRESVE